MVSLIRINSHKSSEVTQDQTSPKNGAATFVSANLRESSTRELSLPPLLLVLFTRPALALLYSSSRDLSLPLLLVMLCTTFSRLLSCTFRENSRFRSCSLGASYSSCSCSVLLPRVVRWSPLPRFTLKNLSFTSRWFCAEGPNGNLTGPLRGCRFRLQLPGASDCYVVSETFARCLK